MPRPLASGPAAPPDPYKNLSTLCAKLAQHVRTQKLHVIARKKRVAAKIARTVFLAHSTSDRKFISICAGNKLLSPFALCRLRNVPRDFDSAEYKLETDDNVFLYASPFRYPNTTCGLLFSPSLETEHATRGRATPFDSGALIEVYTRLDMTEKPRAFLEKHNLPVPRHRTYLERSLAALFAAPSDYIEGKEPVDPGPIGLTGGDKRRWTHEVRLPVEVVVRSAHLQAVFIARGRGLVPEIKKLLRWCKLEGIDVREFSHPRGGAFAALQARCVAYHLARLA